jgi:catechol 2,3-dioxygenase-like lactoylglutathione lyase family enzyme
MAEVQNKTKLDTMHHVAIAVSNVKETVGWYTKRFDCKVNYQDESWALVEFANIRLAFVVSEQHPPHFAILRDPAAYGEPKQHRDGTRSVYVKDPSGNNIEILSLE